MNLLKHYFWSRFLIIRLFLLLVFLVWCARCVEFRIVCRQNCRNGSQIDASKEIELIGECIKGCTDSLVYLWELESFPKNKRQILYPNQTLGFNTSFLTILPNMLYCGEIYDLALYIKHSTGVKVYVVEISMAKCSRKYPPGEELDETQFENDYSDFDDVVASEDDKNLPQWALRSKISDATIALKLMYNKSGSFSIPTKRVEILQLLELIESDDKWDYYRTMNDTIDMANYPPYLPSIVRKGLQVGLTLCNRTLDLLRFPSHDYDSYREHLDRVINIAYYETDTRLHHLVSHRPTPTELPGFDLDPQKDTVDYPDYNDFDLAYKKRKAIIEDIWWLQLEILKLRGIGRTRAEIDSKLVGNVDLESGAICTASVDVLPKLKADELIVYLSEDLQYEIEDTYDLSGMILIVVRYNIFWNRGFVNRHYSVVHLALGSQDNPYELNNLTGPHTWEEDYHFNDFTQFHGNFRLPSYRDYSQIPDDCVAIHKLLVKLPMKAMVIRIDDLDSDDNITVVVVFGRRPKMEDILGNNTFLFRASSDEHATLIHVKATPGSKLYVGLMPTNGTLQINGNWQRFRHHKYRIVLSRVQCDHIDEHDHKFNSEACIISTTFPKGAFNCTCRKMGLYQLSQAQIGSRFLRKRSPIEDESIEAPLNFLPTITLGVVAFVYIVALISKKINRGSNVIVKSAQHLMDNDLSHEFGYVLVVTTRAATTANIAFQLHGSEASTPPHLFRGQSEPVLQTKADDWFYLLTEKDLGDLQSIDLWSDCYGFKSSWYCSKIKVINRQTNQEWTFQVNDWFCPIGRKTFKTVNIENPEETFYFERHVYAVKGLANHLWVKTFTRLQTPVFTFNERIHVLASIITINMMLTMLSLKFSHRNLQFWHFGYTGYDFGVYEVLCGCLSGFCTFGFTTILIYFFSTSERCGSMPSTENLRHSTSWRTGSWLFMMLVLIGSCSVVVFFGLFTGFITSIVWLYTFSIGVVLCIILECFRAMIAGCITRNVDHETLTIDYKSIEIQREKITRGLGKHGMRFLLQKYYSKLSDEEIKEKEKAAQKIKMLRFEKSEFITYVIYMLILFVIIIYDRDPLCYVSANNIRDIFIEDKYLKKIELSEIDSQKRFYRYMRQVFLPAIHTTTWYGSYGSSSPGRLIDFSSKMIGTARIRQIRIRNGTCEVPKQFRHFVDGCHGEYNMFIEDKQHYGEFWMPFNASGERFDSDESWFYKSWSEVKALPFIGELAVYPAGGYTMKFGRTWSNSRIILRYIKNTNWIDERTRAIFLDVNFYNVNDNLFNFLTIAIEQSATGAFITNYQLNTLRFLFHGEIMARILPFMWLSLSAFLVIFPWNKYYQCKEFYSSSWRQLLTDYWNAVDFIITFLIVCLLVTFGIRFLVIESILRGMQLSNNDFISYYDIILCQKAIELTTAILITFSTIRLWKLLRFLRQFRLFELTLAFSAKYLLSMMVINVILISVYAGVGFLLLGPYVKEFRTIWSSFVALMLISFGLEFNLGYDSNHQTMYSYAGYIYFAGYLILVLVLLNIFITIIVVGYNNSKEYLDYQAPQEKYNIFDFLRDDCAYNRSKYKGRIRNKTIVNETNKALKEFRLRAGEDPLVPKISTISFRKVTHNAQTMLEMHQLVDKATTLIQEKYRYTAEERHEQALKVLGHYYHRFSDESQQRTTLYDEYLVTRDEDKENIYCSVKRQNDIKNIVEYLLNKKEPKTLDSIEETKKLIERQMNNVINMRKKSEEMIATLEKLLWEGCRNKSTQVTFEDLGIEVSVASSSTSESSDDIEIEFQDGNIEIILNV